VLCVGTVAAIVLQTEVKSEFPDTADLVNSTVENIKDRGQSAPTDGMIFAKTGIKRRYTHAQYGQAENFRERIRNTLDEAVRDLEKFSVLTMEILPQNACKTGKRTACAILSVRWSEVCGKPGVPRVGGTQRLGFSGVLAGRGAGWFSSPV